MIAIGTDTGQMLLNRARSMAVRRKKHNQIAALDLEAANEAQRSGDAALAAAAYLRVMIDAEKSEIEHLEREFGREIVMLARSSAA